MTTPAEIARAEAELATPLGEPGSGRVRYGAAMMLHRAGMLGDAVLEIYRICSPLDREDPVALLTERGLELPASTLALAALGVAIADYLATLSGPGVGQVRAGLSSARIAAPRSVSATVATKNPVVASHLGAALVALSTTHRTLAYTIGAAAPLLEWITYDRYPRQEIGAAFADGHAYAPVAGGDDYELGLFVIAPDVLYRDHCHRAPELYAPLTGPHGWRFGIDQPLVIKPAHQPVWNEPDAPHLTKVGPVPFLCFYGWVADISEPARVLPAADWPGLEALRLQP